VKKEKARQLLTIFSLFMLLVLPTAIVGYGNFSKLVNQAFAKPFQKEESTFVVQPESSQNITKGGEFSLKMTVASTKSLPLNHFVAFVEFDSTKVDIKSVRVQNTQQLSVVKYQNGFLVYPSTMVTPTSYEALIPATCSRQNTCDFSAFSASSITFTINGVLISDLTAQQRPIKVSIIGAARTSTLAIWNEKLVLPDLKLGEFIKNTIPEFTSEPLKYVTEGTPFEYVVSATDQEKDSLQFSLVCPESAYCDKEQKAPAGLVIEDNKLRWETPVYSDQPYEITVFANDSKSISTQTFSLTVLQKGTAYFACTFTPALSVKILDYRVETPLVIVAESSVDLAQAQVTLSKEGKLEQTFNYEFTPAKKYVILDKSSRPALTFQFNEGQYTGKAEFTSSDGSQFTCDLENPTVSLTSLLKQAFHKTINEFVQQVYAAAGVTVGTNNPPVFTSDPMVPAANGGSSPSVSFVYGTAYAFTLKAKDVDGDPMQHTIVTKPSWTKLAVSSTNPQTGSSTYSIQFTGTPLLKDAGSNLFSVSINDGYGHYITRTWVINIDYPDNDIPKVTIVSPTTSLSRYQGSSFLLKWDAEDRYQIVSFGVYYTTKLGSSTKKTYNKNVAYNTRNMTINTASIPPGDYYFIVTATDGYSPPAIGSGYTAMIRILPPKPKPTPTPTPTPTATATTTPTATPTPTITPTIEPTPLVDEVAIQITSPKSQASIKPHDFKTVISVTASKLGELTVDSLKITLDGTVVTDKFNFSAEKGKSLTASYTPATLLEPGIHELTVYAKDSKQKEKEVKVSFSIITDPESDPNTVNFFGMAIRKDIYNIFIAGLILVVILLLLPIIMYFAYRNSGKDKLEAKKPVTPVYPAGTPTLRTPNNSFAGTTPVQTPQTVTVPARPPMYQPIITPVQVNPSYAPVTRTLPSITPNEALASFVAHAPLQEAKKPVAATSNTAVNPTEEPITFPVRSAVSTTPSQPVFTHVPSASLTKVADKPTAPVQQPAIPKQVPVIEQKPQPPVQKTSLPTPHTPIVSASTHLAPVMSASTPPVIPATRLATPPSIAEKEIKTQSPAAKSPATIPAQSVSQNQVSATLPKMMPINSAAPVPQTPSMQKPHAKEHTTQAVAPQSTVPASSTTTSNTPRGLKDLPPESPPLPKL